MDKLIAHNAPESTKKFFTDPDVRKMKRCFASSTMLELLEGIGALDHAMDRAPKTVEKLERKEEQFEACNPSLDPCQRKIVGALRRIPVEEMYEKYVKSQNE